MSPLSPLSSRGDQLNPPIYLPSVVEELQSNESYSGAHTPPAVYLLVSGLVGTLGSLRRLRVAGSFSFGGTKTAAVLRGGRSAIPAVGPFGHFMLRTHAAAVLHAFDVLAAERQLVETIIMARMTTPRHEGTWNAYEYLIEAYRRADATLRSLSAVRGRIWANIVYGVFQFASCACPMRPPLLGSNESKKILC